MYVCCDQFHIFFVLCFLFVVENVSVRLVFLSSGTTHHTHRSKFHQKTKKQIKLTQEIIGEATRTILNETGVFYTKVTVDTVSLTTTEVEANIYVLHTDISQEDLVELIDTNLESAIQEADDDGYFSQVTSISAEPSIIEAPSDSNKSDDIPWELIIIIIAIILGAIVACGLYDYFCVNKVAHETSIQMNNDFRRAPSTFGTTPGGTTGTQTSEPELPNETGDILEMNRLESQSNTGVVVKYGGNDLIPDLPAQPEVNQGAYETNRGDELAEEALDQDVPAVTKGGVTAGGDDAAAADSGPDIPAETDGGETAGAAGEA